MENRNGNKITYLMLIEDPQRVIDIWVNNKCSKSRGAVNKTFIIF